MVLVIWTNRLRLSPPQLYTLKAWMCNLNSTFSGLLTDSRCFTTSATFTHPYSDDRSCHAKFRTWSSGMIQCFLTKHPDSGTAIECLPRNSRPSYSWTTCYAIWATANRIGSILHSSSVCREYPWHNLWKPQPLDFKILYVVQFGQWEA